MESEIDYYSLIKDLLKRIPHKHKVRFALFCAKDCKEFVSKKYIAVVDNALRLVEEWLRDPASVKREELVDAADAASYAAAYAADAAYAAANAAADAAYATAYAVNAAADSASCTATVARRDEKYKYYYEWLVESISPLQKAMWLKKY